MVFTIKYTKRQGVQYSSSRDNTPWKNVSFFNSYSRKRRRTAKWWFGLRFRLLAVSLWWFDARSRQDFRSNSGSCSKWLVWAVLFPRYVCVFHSFVDWNRLKYVLFVFECPSAYTREASASRNDFIYSIVSNAFEWPPRHLARISPRNPIVYRFTIRKSVDQSCVHVKLVWLEMNSAVSMLDLFDWKWTVLCAC